MPIRHVVIGDADRDLEAARRAGVRAVPVRTGKGEETERRLGGAPVPVYDDLRSAAAAIVEAGGSAPGTGELQDVDSGSVRRALEGPCRGGR